MDGEIGDGMMGEEDVGRAVGVTKEPPLQLPNRLIEHLFAYSDGTTNTISCKARHHSLYMHYLHEHHLLMAIRIFIHTIPYDGGESTSSPASPHQGTSSTTVTVPRQSAAVKHVKRCLCICMPNSNGTRATNWGDQGLSTLDMF